jgi:F-type H+-transporting ATPase subunit b
MHIDWFVFFSQIVNLLILMFLLKKFLFGRIIGAMDAREAKIGAVFTEAEKSRQEAQAAAESHKTKLRELEAGYEQMLNKTRQDAEAYHEELLVKAREEVDFLKARWMEALRSERANFLQELRRLAGHQIYAVSRRVLKDLAGLDLEERIVEILMERIEALDEQERKKFQGPAENGGSVIISCAFEIPAATQARLNDVLHRFFSDDVTIAYERSDDVLSGCELRSDGHKIAWSAKDYLDSLEERFYSALYEESQEWKQSKEGDDHEQHSDRKG